jgi:hypothetical protein
MSKSADKPKKQQKQKPQKTLKSDAARSARRRSSAPVRFSQQTSRDFRGRRPPAAGVPSLGVDDSVARACAEGGVNRYRVHPRCTRRRARPAAYCRRARSSRACGVPVESAKPPTAGEASNGTDKENARAVSSMPACDLAQGHADPLRWRESRGRDIDLRGASEVPDRPAPRPRSTHRRVDHPAAS